MIRIQIRQQLADLFPGDLIAFLFHIGKGQTDHRVGSLKRAVLPVPPDGQPFKQISPACILHREKLFHHAHGQGFPESARTGNQRNAVFALPPFPDEACFIHVKTIFFYDVTITLNPDSNGTRHFPVSLFLFPAAYAVSVFSLRHNIITCTKINVFQSVGQAAHSKTASLSLISRISYGVV